MALYAVDVTTGEVVCELPPLPEVNTLNVEHEECCIGVDLADCEDMTVTFTGTVDRLALFSILTGKRITNNYLKYHGGVMQRKRHRRA